MLVERARKVHCHLTVFRSWRWGHLKFSFHELVRHSVVRHRQQLVGVHRLGECCAHKYSSTFLTISRIWKGRPLTLEKATASTKYFARIIVQSWPRFIS